MNRNTLRQRQRLDPLVARQFIEPVFWQREDTTGSPERATAHDLAEQAQQFRLHHAHRLAIACYEQALELFRQHGTPEELARCLMDFASCLHRRRESVAMLTRARMLCEEALSRFVQLGSSPDIADCLLNLAKVCEDGATDSDHPYRQLAAPIATAPAARYDTAIEYYDFALAQYRHNGAAPEDIAACLIGRGNALHTMFRIKLRSSLDTSLRDLEQAYAMLVDAGAAPVFIAESLQNLANGEHSAGMPVAYQHQMDALEMLRKAGTPARDRLRSANHTLSQWHKETGDLPLARQFADTAIGIAEQLVQGALSRDHKIELRTQYATSLQNAIRICLLMQPPANEAAFAYAQRLKGRLVTEQMELRRNQSLPGTLPA